MPLILRFISQITIWSCKIINFSRNSFYLLKTSCKLGELTVAQTLVAQIVSSI